MGLMAKGIEMGPGMLHHGEHSRGAATRPLLGRTVGVAVAAVQRVMIPGLVSGVDRHPGKTRLFQVINARREQRIEPRREHEGILRCEIGMNTPVGLSVSYGEGKS